MIVFGHTPLPSDLLSMTHGSGPWKGTVFPYPPPHHPTFSLQPCLSYQWFLKHLLHPSAGTLHLQKPNGWYFWRAEALWGAHGGSLLYSFSCWGSSQERVLKNDPHPGSQSTLWKGKYPLSSCLPFLRCLNIQLCPQRLFMSHKCHGSVCLPGEACRDLERDLCKCPGSNPSSSPLWDTSKNTTSLKPSSPYL